MGYQHRKAVSGLRPRGRLAAYSTDLCNQYINLRANVPEAKWWASVNGMTRNGELCETQIKAASGRDAVQRQILR